MSSKSYLHMDVDDGFSEYYSLLEAVVCDGVNLCFVSLFCKC